jgi:hypothetical protein
MKKIILVNGLIAGVIVSAMFVISIPLQIQGLIDLNNGMIIGYTSMVIALSTIFLGIKTFRDQYSNGSISFWQGFKIGMSIALVAGVIYALTWEVYYSFKGDEFVAYYQKCMIDDLRSDGATEAEIAEKRAEFSQYFEMYKNPFIRFAMTLAEILPVGIIISLVAAGVLRKQEILPATR